MATPSLAMLSALCNFQRVMESADLERTPCQGHLGRNFSDRIAMDLHHKLDAKNVGRAPTSGFIGRLWVLSFFCN